MEFDNLAFQLVIEMRKSPVATLSNLAERLNVSVNTIKARQQSLRENGIIRDFDTVDDPLLGTREISDVVAHHSYQNLGLQRIHIIFQKVDAMDQMWKILGDYPYTYYQTVGMSSSPVIYVIFDIPNGNLHRLIELVDHLQIKNYFSDYFVLDPTYLAKSEDDLRLWRKNPNWDVSLDTIIDDETIGNRFEKYLNSTPEPDRQSFVDNTPNLDSLDLNLIRELTLNSKISPTTLSQWYDRDRSTMSRRLQSIRENYIIRNTLIYNRKAFNLNSTFLIYGKLNTPQYRAILALMNDDYIPYMSQLHVDELGRFLWHLFAPPSFCNEILHGLLSPNLSIHLVLLNPIRGIRYYFFPDNYNLEEHAWKESHEYMVDPFIDE